MKLKLKITLLTREKLTNYIQESSKKTYFIVYDFFYISYEPRHHFVVQKIITHILTLKKLLLKTELYVLLNLTLLKCQSMTLSVTPAIWPLLRCYAIFDVELRVKSYGRGRGKQCTNCNDQQQNANL
jgi:hypothetical protein